MELEAVLRIILAAVLGGVIGYQRERIGKAAGLRTIVLICIGAAVFAVVTVYGFGVSDTGRAAITAGVVTGVGFLGAGTILRSSEGHVEGLTTAATIWAMAGVGTAVGVGLYLIGVVSTLVVLVTLLLPHINPRS